MPVIHTRVATSPEELIDRLSSVDQEVVDKPVLSVGSVDTGRFAADDLQRCRAGAAHPWKRLPSDGIQPAVPSVATEGEISAVLFAGQLSHAFRRPQVAEGEERMDTGAEVRYRSQPTSTGLRRRPWRP